MTDPVNREWQGAHAVGEGGQQSMSVAVTLARKRAVALPFAESAQGSEEDTSQKQIILAAAVPVSRRTYQQERIGLSKPSPPTGSVRPRLCGVNSLVFTVSRQIPSSSSGGRGGFGGAVAQRARCGAKRASCCGAACARRGWRAARGLRTSERLPGWSSPATTR